MRKLFSFSFIIILGVILSLPTNATKLSVSDYVDYQENTSWSEAMEWAISEGILSGYPEEKKLKPYEYVTEAQMTVMLLNFLNQSEVKSYTKSGSKAGEHWSSPYYELAKMYHFELSYLNTKKRDHPIRRGTIAKFLAQSLTGKKMSEQDAVQWMYDSEISYGHLEGFDDPPKTYESYHPNEKLSRAHAVIFLYNIYKNLEEKSLKAIEQEPNEISFNGFKLGDPQSKFEQLYGVPKRVTMNGDGLKVHTYYHNNYEDFLVVGYDEQNQAAFLYSNQEIFTSRLNNINLTDRSTVNSYFDLNSLEGSSEVMIDENKITFYYDTLLNEIPVRAIQIKQNNWDITNTLKLHETNDFLIFDITNSYRKNSGQKSLEWNDKIANTAYKHSEDMFINNYFSHTNQKGQDPFDRIITDGIDYSNAGENIAFGFSNGITAIEVWMNSLHHRETILKSSYTHLGVGSHSWYYTQNFLTPLD